MMARLVSMVENNRTMVPPKLKISFTVGLIPRFSEEGRLQITSSNDEHYLANAGLI